MTFVRLLLDPPNFAFVKFNYKKCKDYGCEKLSNEYKESFLSCFIFVRKTLIKPYFLIHFMRVSLSEQNKS